ncbi:PilX N-terminal [Anaerovirgula multivorans]|uniref:PilX N-terminal n=1 Tax=Anaerovirgula multivorans TaxID=312168 RepID=A0A238ZUY0_9FIRM|nr:PilX N-terminal domain-containing pilus assembly protein [Anaerovirgula multivorans]SNR86473.1 PilX N-terminal [Anaerovirgula multivorans]
MKFTYSLKKYLYNDSGLTLIFVIMILVILSLIGLTLLSVTTSNVKMSSIERDYQGVFYIAEAGINYKLNEINSEIIASYISTSTVDDFFNTIESYFSVPSTLDTFESTFGNNPVVNITIIGSRVTPSNTATYTIISQGIIGSHTRTVETEIEVTWIPKTGMSISNDMAVFSNSTINLTGSATINGPAGINATTNNSITLDGGSAINGDIYVGPGAGSEVLNVPHWISVSDPIQLAEVRSFEMPDFPTIPTYLQHPNTQAGSYNVILNGSVRIDNSQANNYVLQLNNNIYAPEIKIASNYTLDINVGDTDKSIVVDHLNIINGHINIQGTGKLTIYVTDKITMGSGSTINNVTNPAEASVTVEKLNIYLKASAPAKTVTLAGSQKIYGSLYAENANILFTAGGGFQGHIVTGGTDVTINGGAAALVKMIYAPNAHVKLENGGNVIGSIIANSFTASGGTNVSYVSTEDENLPFFPIGGGSTPALEDLIQINTIKEK